MARCRIRRPSGRARARDILGAGLARRLGMWGLLGLLVLTVRPGRGSEPEGLAEAKGAFQAAQSLYQGEPTNAQAAWNFGRACFDLAEYATKNSERAHLAQQGIAACRYAVSNASDAAPAHYYLGMNLGQLARTKFLGALKLVSQMEHEFSRARELDSQLDYAGPDRNLGLLYLEAPSVGSVGDEEKAREHLKRALELAPEYPENRLNVIQVYLKSGDKAEARAQLKLYEEQLPAAQQRFAGPTWATSWGEWNTQLAHFRKKLKP